MRSLMGLLRRNLLLYFKDAQAILFSLLTSVIVFVLYLLFLKGTFVDAIEGAMRGLEGMIQSEDLNMLVNGILLTGIMGSAMITVPYSCLTVVIQDKEQKIDYDISATPMKRWKIVLAYFLSSCISAFVMTALILTIGLIILKTMGELHLSVVDIIRLYGVIALGAVSATGFFMVLVQFFKTTSAGNAFFGMLSAAAGFVIGAYIPISEFSSNVQTVCNLFPASHITVLFRKGLLSGILNHINSNLNGIDGGAFAEGVRENFSFQANMFKRTMTTGWSLVYIISIALISIILMTGLYRITNKRR